MLSFFNFIRVRSYLFRGIIIPGLPIIYNPLDYTPSIPPNFLYCVNMLFNLFKDVDVPIWPTYGSSITDSSIAYHIMLEKRINICDYKWWENAMVIINKAKKLYYIKNGTLKVSFVVWSPVV